MMALIQRFQLARKYAAAGCPSPWRWAGTALRRVKQASRGQVPPVRMPPPPTDQTPAWKRFYAEHWGCRRCGYYNLNQHEACGLCHAGKAGGYQPVYLEDEGSPTRFAGAPRSE